MCAHRDGALPTRYNNHHEPKNTGRIAETSQSSGSDKGTKQVVSAPRKALIKAMGLAYDPFNSGVSELDLAPDFGSIYVDARPGLLEQLRRPEASCFYAAYGMGKTATRLALEYELRLARTPRALCVTYSPRLDEIEAQETQSSLRLLDAVAVELRVDLAIQYIERLPERQADGDHSQRPLAQLALERQARALPSRITTLMRAALHESQADGAFWRPLRSVVRFVSPTQHWHALLELMLVNTRRNTQLPSWETTLFDTRSLGFNQIYLLIDAVDNQGFEPEEYLRIVHPLIAVAAELEGHGVFLKMFLPVELETELATYAKSYGLTLPRAVATIDKLSVRDLDSILRDRLRAAQSPAADFSFHDLDLLGVELGESVQQWLVHAAKGSPRRLLDLASALIDFHSLNGFRNDDRLSLTRSEWQRFLDDIERPSLLHTDV